MSHHAVYKLINSCFELFCIKKFSHFKDLYYGIILTKDNSQKRLNIFISCNWIKNVHGGTTPFQSSFFFTFRIKMCININFT